MYSSGLRVVIVNGKPGVGKTTFENLCARVVGNAYCNKRSTVDKIKEIAANAGWDGVKDAAARKMLSDLKDIFTEYNDMPFNDILKFLDEWEAELVYYNVSHHPHILFVDDREPEHIDRLKKALKATTLLIRRPDVEEEETSNHADENVFEYKYDWVINNNSDLTELYEEAKRFVNSIFS
jgi:dephospho-CoA kinase